MLQLVAWLLISFCATVDNFETVHGVLQEHQSKYAALEGVFRCFDAMTVIASDKVLYSSGQGRGQCQSCPRNIKN